MDNEYVTGNGMSFIGNRWVYTGSEGYRVQFDASGPNEDGYAVFHFNAARSRLCQNGLTEQAAHKLAGRLVR